MSLSVSACGSDGATPHEAENSGEAYWALTLNHHAVTLSTPDTPPYDTLPLVATPRTIEGRPLPDLPPVQYRSSDPERVVVTADGVLRARASTPDGPGVLVVATLTAGNLTHADTVEVKVLAVETPPVLASLSIHGGDSAKTEIEFAPTVGSGTTCFALPTWVQTPNQCRILLPVTVLDAGGVPISGVPVALRSSDNEVAAINMQSSFPGQIWGKRLGEVTFYASTTVFGVAKADTLPFRIGWPVQAAMNVSRASLFGAPVLRVGTGATVKWDNTDPLPIDVTFTNPTHVAKLNPPPGYTRPFLTDILCPQLAAACEGEGNFVLGPTGSISPHPFTVLRRFPVPGTYDYYSSTLGAGGRIIVMDER